MTLCKQFSDVESVRTRRKYASTCCKFCSWREVTPGDRLPFSCLSVHLEVFLPTEWTRSSAQQLQCQKAVIIIHHSSRSCQDSFTGRSHRWLAAHLCAPCIRTSPQHVGSRTAHALGGQAGRKMRRACACHAAAPSGLACGQVTEARCAASGGGPAGGSLFVCGLQAPSQAIWQVNTNLKVVVLLLQQTLDAVVP